MRRVVSITLAALLLSGCLEEVEPLSSIGNPVFPGSVTLAWQPPTENADGSPLTDLSGYTIYVGTEPNSYSFREIRLDNPGLTTYVVDNLGPGTYYFAATAFNSSGVESSFSGEVAKTVL